MTLVENVAVKDSSCPLSQTAQWRLAVFRNEIQQRISAKAVPPATSRVSKTFPETDHLTDEQLRSRALDGDNDALFAFIERHDALINVKAREAYAKATQAQRRTVSLEDVRQGIIENILRVKGNRLDMGFRHVAFKFSHTPAEETVRKMSLVVSLPIRVVDGMRKVRALQYAHLIAGKEPPTLEEMSEFIGRPVGEVVAPWDHNDPKAPVTIHDILNGLALERSLFLEGRKESETNPYTPSVLGMDNLVSHTQAPLLLPDECAEKNELSDDVMGLLRKLAPRDQKIVGLKFGLGGTPELTLEEIGIEVGMTRQGVQQRLHRIIDRLRYLDEEWGNKLSAHLEPTDVPQLTGFR